MCDETIRVLCEFPLFSFVVEVVEQMSRSLLPTHADLLEPRLATGKYRIM